MITSHSYSSHHHHAHHASSPHQAAGMGHHTQQEVSQSKIDPATGAMTGVPGSTDMKMNNRAGNGTNEMGGPNSADPFQTTGFGEDDFDIPPINIPPSALGESDPSQGGHQNYNYHHQQQQMMHHQSQNNMYQQHWGHQQQYQHMNGYHQHHHQYNDQYYHSQGYGQQQMYGGHQTMAVGPGGPSPVGSHNTPSPQAHSEDGDDHIRNNNVLKRPSPDHQMNSHHRMGTGPNGMGGQSMTGGGGGGGGGYVAPPGPYVIPQHTGIPPVAKKPKVSKRKKKRDPNEPQKPVSAYALFFRDSQASIKQANPNAAFGDVSKIVASMWDALDPDSKAAYKKRTENAKKDYLKKLAAYRASLVSRGSGTDSYYGYGYTPPVDAAQNGIKPAGYMSGTVTPSGYMGQPIPPRPPMQHSAMNHMGQTGSYMMHGQMHNGGMMSGSPHHGMHQGQGQHSPMAGGPPNPNQPQPQHSPTNSSHSPNSHNLQNLDSVSSNNSTTPTGAGAGGGTGGQQPSPVDQRSTGTTNPNGTNPPTTASRPSCSRPGCSNPVQRNAEGWNSEYCSNECVVGQCREVYTNWSSTNGPPPHGNPNSSGPGNPTGMNQPQYSAPVK